MEKYYCINLMLFTPCQDCHFQVNDNSYICSGHDNYKDMAEMISLNIHYVVTATQVSYDILPLIQHNI